MRQMRYSVLCHVAGNRNGQADVVDTRAVIMNVRKWY